MQVQRIAPQMRATGRETASPRPPARRRDFGGLGLARPRPNPFCNEFTHSPQASTEHFQQRAEFLPLRNRGLGPIPPPCNRQRPLSPARGGAATACSKRMSAGEQPLQFQKARQCGARTKSGKPCRSPATCAPAAPVAFFASPSGNLYKRQSYLGIPAQALMLRAGAPSSYSPRSIAGAFCLEKPRLGPRQRGVGGCCLAGFKIALSGARKLSESTQVFAALYSNISNANHFPFPAERRGALI